MSRLARSADPDRRLKKGFREIEAICEKLNLTAQRTKDRANEVFKRMSDINLQRAM